MYFQRLIDHDNKLKQYKLDKLKKIEEEKEKMFYKNLLYSNKPTFNSINKDFLPQRFF